MRLGPLRVRALVLVFFFLKDGPKFVPWLARNLGKPTGSHVGEVLNRMWASLGGFIRTQAIVSAVDAVLIGVGLVVLGVPLAFALAVLAVLDPDVSEDGPLVSLLEFVPCSVPV